MADTIIAGNWRNPDDHGNQPVGAHLIGGSKQPLNEKSATQRHRLGELLELPDGTRFRYVKTVGAVGIGKVLAHDVSAANVASITGRLSDKTLDSGAAGDSTYAVGDTEIYVQDSTVFASDTATENEFAGGYLGISNEGGEGGRYAIKANTIGDANEVQGMIKFTLYEPGLAVALASEASLWVIGNRYNNCKIATANTDSPPIGVAMQTTVANDYVWALTRGVANVLCDESAGTVAINTPAVISDGVDGALTVLGQGTAASEENLAQLTTEGIVGYWLTAGVDTEYVPCFVHFE